MRLASICAVDKDAISLFLGIADDVSVLLLEELTVDEGPGSGSAAALVGGEVD